MTPDPGDRNEKVILTDITPQTGNIDFPGYVRICGEVKGGVTVSGKSGVDIVGTVYDAKIFSDGNINVVGSVVGGEGAILKAAKLVRATNIENAAVVAETVICEGRIKKARIYAYNVIEAMGDTGEVALSQCRVGNKFTSNILGAAGDNETVVDVEMVEKRRILQRLLSLEEEMNATRDELDKLQRVVGMVKLMGDKVRELSPDKQKDLKEKLERVIALQTTLKSSEQTQEALSRQVESFSDDANFYPIEVLRRVVRGVTLKIDGATLQMGETIDGTVLYHKKKRIQVKVK